MGKGSDIIQQIRQGSGASTKADGSSAEGDDYFLSVKEFFEDPSPIIGAALQLRSRRGEKIEREHSDSVISTRLLAPNS
ncbi:hypothetical protein PVL29_002547 [Vitis rotundifolia]|uniref:Uncharacterized protein n=1 Tax=Vitis rotundifolia TaxID=103349 RepID=A0AA39AI90_VITRO|nr:hypothetical protein PVL29_002547 [Vitis rotundifolia]